MKSIEKINKFCAWFSKQLIVWVILMVAAGYLFPGTLIPLKNFSDWLFAFTMLGIGMVLSPQDISQIYKKPVPVFLGSLAGKLFGFNEKYCRTLSIGVGMQNAGLGAVLSIKHFSNETAIPNVLFATWSIISAAILARYWTRGKNKTAESKPEGIE